MSNHFYNEFEPGAAAWLREDDDLEFADKRVRELEAEVAKLNLQVEQLQKFVRKVADVTPERYAAFGAQAFMALPREATALLANEVKRKPEVDESDMREYDRQRGDRDNPDNASQR